jgi:acyl carrier protein
MEHMSVHILDEDLAPVADGETGELYVGGLGVARGYVGRPGLTAERFVADPFTGAGQRMYRTGDLGRRLPDGQIDFAGRTDDQVKIRDFRVELAEVGSALACQPGVAQVVVVPRRVEIGDTRLAAFLVPSPGGFDLAAVRAGAAATLPAYMVPTEFTVLDALPLTPNHKIDRGALLALEPTDVAPDTADEPLTADQETLCRLFAEVLGRPRVNPRDDFFDLGGQSILGLRLISRIEAEFGTQLEIADLFNAPTVAQIAELVSAASSDGEAPGAVAEPEVEDRIPLAFPQLFLNAFDQGEPTGPIGTRYHLADGWLVRGEVDVETLRDALADVVARHEALRTSVAHDENGAYQVVHPPMPALLDVVDLSGVAPDDRERRADELLIEVESREFDVRELPLVRAVLGRFDERESVLALLCHHTAVDGWSMRTLIGDLAALYAVRRGHDVSLPAPRQYREFARWQHEVAPTGLERKLEYWRETLRDAHVTVLRADHPRSAGLPPATAVHRFEIPPDVIATTGKLARSTQSSLFMVLLAAFYGMHHRLTGHADVVVPTFTPGRSEEFEKTVGSFFNFLPLRVDLTGVTTFRDILERTRNTCFRAYTNDIPTMHVFSQAPELMAPAMTDDGVAFVFQVFLIPDVMDGERIGDLKLTEMRYRLTSHPVGSDVPGALWTLNVTSTGSGIGSVQFNSNLLDEPTMNGLATEYCRLLKELVTAPDAPLSTP